MQLVFYPQGCAGARPGFCSFFLSCPPGCTLRCWLWAGRWRREARAEQPDLVGRMNFARFENVIDPVDESVELVLEIEEAHQTRKATTSSQPLPLEGSKEEVSTSGVGPSVEQTREVGWIERSDTSTSKIQHNSGKAPSTDGAVQQLPSIWTTQGFHSFSDLDDGSNMRVSTASTAKGGQSSPTPRPPQQARAKRKGNGPNSARQASRDTKYKEYSQAGLAAVLLVNGTEVPANREAASCACTLAASRKRQSLAAGPLALTMGPETWDDDNKEKEAKRLQYKNSTMMFGQTDTWEGAVAAGMERELEIVEMTRRSLPRQTKKAEKEDDENKDLYGPEKENRLVAERMLHLKQKSLVNSEDRSRPLDGVGALNEPSMATGTATRRLRKLGPVGKPRCLRDMVGG
eukprot:Skav217213  [mRNA]  locus=scaffold143:224235:231852:- [translate_table: standard]